jgi:butyrate response factor 1
VTSSNINHLSSVDLASLISNGFDGVAAQQTEEIWFKLPSNSSTAQTNWNEFVGGSADGTMPNFDENFLDSAFWGDKGSGYPRLQRNIDIEAELSRQNLYKTELCRSWVESATCKYGSKCQFAHGQHELRPVIRHPKYKTEICKTFHTNGTCPYGKRCRFVHNPAEIRLPTGDGMDDLPLGDTAEDEELRQLQERLKLTQLAPDPVFITPVAAPPFRSLSSERATPAPSTSSKKGGSGLPFFQKLRKQKF